MPVVTREIVVDRTPVVLTLFPHDRRAIASRSVDDKLLCSLSLRGRTPAQVLEQIRASLRQPAPAREPQAWRSHALVRGAQSRARFV